MKLETPYQNLLVIELPRAYSAARLDEKEWEDDNE